MTTNSAKSTLKLFLTHPMSFLDNYGSRHTISEIFSFKFLKKFDFLLLIWHFVCSDDWFLEAKVFQKIEYFACKSACNHVF